MKPLSAGIWLESRNVLRFCAWAVLVLAILVTLSSLFYVLNGGVDGITGFLPNPERSWDRLLWRR
jgi:hypothetical protein